VSGRARAALAVALLVFVLVSLGVARVLGANSAERGAIDDVVAAEARGDGRALARLVGRCEGGCARLAARLRRRGAVQVIRVDPATRVALGALDGTTRVAWKAAGAPLAQCVRVRRRGDVVSGLDSRLVAVSAPIGIERGCPGGD
jgi:hypothetical protein